MADQELVIGAVRLLTGHRARVYIDKKDPELPPYTSKNTAIGLKKRIHTAVSEVHPPRLEEQQGQPLGAVGAGNRRSSQGSQ